MSYIKLYDKITKTIDKITRSFIWGCTNDKRKMHLVNRAIVTSSKEQVGLGLKKCDTRNRAMLAGLAWRLLEHPRKLWAKILLNKYKKNPFRWTCWKGGLQNLEEHPIGMERHFGNFKMSSLQRK